VSSGCFGAVLGALALPGGAASAATAPWPTMRHDVRNTVASSIRARYDDRRPWSVLKAKGIFSTTVVGADGTVYVGSADHTFVAVRENGTPRWRLDTGGIVDARRPCRPTAT